MIETALRAADVLDIEIRSSSDGRDQRTRWALAIIAVGIAVVLSVLTSGSFEQLVPKRRILITRKDTGAVLVQGDAPPLRGNRLVKSMRFDAARWSEAKFLTKWVDSQNWHRMIWEPVR